MTVRTGQSLLVAGFCISLACNAPGGGGGNGGGNGGGDGNGGGQSLVVRGTNTFADPVGEIKAGRTIIAVGTGQGSGVQYVDTASGDTAARSLSNFDTFMTAGFGVTGNSIIVRTFEGNVGLFDADTQQLTMFDETVLSRFSGAAAPGSPEFEGDGDFFLTLADPTRVADGLRVKLVDLTASPPAVISYPDPPVTPVVGREGEVPQIAIDAAARQFVVQITDSLVLYEIDDPTAQPQVADLSGVGGVSNRQKIHLDQGRVIYQAFEQSGNGRELTRIADFGAGNSILLSENPSRNRPMDLESGAFGYFAHVEDNDVNTNDTVRSVFGTIGASDPQITILNDARTPIGDDPADGIIGFGCTLAITPNAEFFFVAGCGTVADAEYLQVSTGGAFQVLPDQLDVDPLGLGTPASKVDASNSLAAFETRDGRVGYIELPQ